MRPPTLAPSTRPGRPSSPAHLALLAGLAALLAPGAARAQQVIISEFLASNASNLADEDGEFSDWIELANIGGAPVSLEGWFLSDNAANRMKWRLPAVTLAPNEHKLVWASNKNRSNPAAPLHTNFKLGAEGEYLGLTRPDGVTVEHQYAPTFPAQSTDISYGASTDATVASFVVPGAPARAFVPSNGNLGLTWTTRAFSVPASWLTGVSGVGFERGTGYEALIGLNVNSVMYNRNASCYMRFPFTIADAPAFSRLTLRMKYDDGFIAYLNGQPVAASNAPASPAWNSSATQGHPDDQAVVYQDFDVTAGAGALVQGTNVLAIHGLNLATTNTDFLILPELIATTPGSYNPTLGAFYTTPTPGAFNTASGADRGPAISDHAAAPALPADGDPITVTARVRETFGAVQSVSLTYRVDYGAPTSLPMLDDGAHGDGQPGDGVYGAVIPASASSPGQMVRWVISAVDAASNASRLPLFASPTQNPEYFGVMIADPAVSSQLPVLSWWVQDPAAAGTDSGTRCSLFYLGRFYDNVFVRLRGQSSAGWPKPHYKLDFNAGDHFVYDPALPPVEEFNLQSTYSDKAYLRQVLSWETYRAAGAAGCTSFMLRVQQNGAFHSVAAFVEQPDEDMLARNGLDNSGVLYKMYNQCDDAFNNIEKKTREYEDNSDLAALVAGLQTPTGPALSAFLFDHVDVPATISYIAATTIIHDNDHPHKNYYTYRDTEGSGEWTMLPWDKDLTFGRNYGAGGGVLSDGIWADLDPFSHPLFGDQQHPKIDGPWNRFIDAMHREPTIRQMYLRRLRTLMDELLQPPGTPIEDRAFETRIDELVDQCLPDVLLDRARWGNPYGENQDFLTAIDILKHQYLDVRRTHLYFTHSAPGGIIPAAQSPGPAIAFGAAERSPADGDQEYLELINPMAEAVDISGWRLAGDIEHTFRPGTVIPAGGSLFATPSVVAFRARTTSPKGGEGRFIQGDYRGRLSLPAEELTLTDADGRTVAVIHACPADYNADGFLDFFDYDEFVGGFESGDPRADFNRDDFIDFFDYDAFVGAFQAGC